MCSDDPVYAAWISGCVHMICVCCMDKWMCSDDLCMLYG